MCETCTLRPQFLVLASLEAFTVSSLYTLSHFLLSQTMMSINHLRYDHTIAKSLPHPRVSSPALPIERSSVTCSRSKIASQYTSMQLFRSCLRFYPSPRRKVLSMWRVLSNIYTSGIYVLVCCNILFLLLLYLWNHPT